MTNKFEWISVEDALPTPETSVLVWPPNRCDGSVCYGFMKDGAVDWVRNFSDGYTSYTELHYEKITHWMYDPRDFPPLTVGG